MRDQRIIYRGYFDQLSPETSYILGVSFLKTDLNETTIKFFKFRTLPPDNLSMVVASNKLNHNDSVIISIDAHSEMNKHINIGTTDYQNANFVVVMGNIAYDYGFDEGYFLYDLFFTKFS